MKSILGIAAVAALAVVGYLVLSPKQATEQATTTAPVIETPAPVEDTAAAAAEAAKEQAATAAEAVKETAAEAVDTAKEAVADTAEAVQEKVAETVAPATETEMPLADLFTIEGFDYEKAIAAIDASELNVAVKMATKSALEGARDNPDLLKDVLANARDLLGLNG